MKFHRPVAIASYRKLVGYQAGLLAGTCALVAALILIGNTVTSERIQAMEKADQLKMLGEVLPPEFYDNDLLADQLTLSVSSAYSSKKANNSVTDESSVGRDSKRLLKPLTVYVAKSDNKMTAMAFPVVANGYGGDINMIVGVDVNGTILGVRVINHKETPGLGDKIEISRDQWITKFDGLSLANTPDSSWAVKKDGGQFDQFTGATITPRAIVRAVYQGLIIINQQQQAITKAVKERLPLDGSLAMIDNKEGPKKPLSKTPVKNTTPNQSANHVRDINTSPEKDQSEQESFQPGKTEVAKNDE